MASRNGRSGANGFHMSVTFCGPMPWTSTADSAPRPSSSGHRPRRQATAATPATEATLTSAAVHSIARASPPVSRYSGADSQYSSGPGWAQPLTVYAPTRGVSRVPTCEVRNARLAQSPTGNHVWRPRATAATTIGLTTSATSATCARPNRPTPPCASRSSRALVTTAIGPPPAALRRNGSYQR
jgi:hypothetical protein